MTTYQQALDYIYSFADYERSPSPGSHTFDLTGVTRLLGLIGDPQKRYRSVHIAGTKGKGSTVAVIESILRSAGYRTGLYISPHLHTYRERIQVAGQLIREEEVIEYVEGLRPFIQQVPGLTTFDITTTLAFKFFADKDVEWAVLETGLGGRLDATNIVDPQMAVITTIGYDHMSILGRRLSQIAWEKAGIIKSKRPVVSAPQRPSAARVIAKAARARGAPLTLVGRDWLWKGGGFDLDGQTLTIRDLRRDRVLENLFIPLLGEHQLVNATTAVAGVSELRLGLSEEAIAQGLRKVSWPGRFEILNRRPLLVIDGAHTPEAVQQLMRTICHYLKYQRLVLIFGASFDKEIRKMLAALLPRTWRVILAKAHHPRATDTQALAATVHALGHDPIRASSVAEALKNALDLAGGNDLICITGSLFVIAEARAAWLESRGVSLETDPPPREA